MAEEKEFLIDSEDEGQRLDIFLAAHSEGLSRSGIQKIIDASEVTVNGQTAKRNHRLKHGEKVIFHYPEPEETAMKPEAISLNVLFEDSDIIVVNKPQGMVVHPAPGNREGTLVNALLHHCSDLAGVGGRNRPGIVHRLDKDTSGVLVAAKNDFAHLALVEQMRRRAIKRIYKALVHGQVEQDRGMIDAPIGRSPRDRKKMAVVFKNSKPAITHFRVMERFRDHTLVELRLETGRTHQIRVHMAYIKHPVVGDRKYGTGRNNLGFEGQALHAGVLALIHPRTAEELEFHAPLPEHFETALDVLRREEVR